MMTDVRTRVLDVAARLRRLRRQPFDELAAELEAIAAVESLAEAALVERDGWMCEAHPGHPWPECPIVENCPGPGMPWTVQGRAVIEGLRRQ